ncbi:hypothetical protein HVTV-2_gp176 [Haloarcula virus HVTV-2]|uniref:Uncharacterized protein n=1 Tax=Haloarcula vallismortis tailed virus 1 TaxID=1262528 RepID=L7TNX2_9CAUD|nr:hypothetical protein HVTV1_174 [Haloarcula vallismortis tailed virus 1]AGC34542.1 hypothetical protein HVTV1_174 [Haloarcula vallismortis tailed virus 1]UBF22983.1 hypothetical protein HVTV-2_gp176 [Haloarcula virus HVTV-2]
MLFVSPHVSINGVHRSMNRAINRYIENNTNGYDERMRHHRTER